MMAEDTPKPDALSRMLAKAPPPDVGSSNVPEALAAANVPATEAVATDQNASNRKEDFSQKREFLWNVHSYTNDYIRFVDTKAGFCAGLASALIGALFAAKAQDLFLNPLAHTRGADWTALSCLSLAAFLLLGISIGVAVTVVKPRLWTHSDKGFIYWGAISTFDSANSFAAQFGAKTESDLDECLAHHLYTLAKICERKYTYTGIAILAAVCGGALAVTVLLFKP